MRILNGIWVRVCAVLMQWVWAPIAMAEAAPWVACARAERGQITRAVYCWQDGRNKLGWGGVDRCHAVRVGTCIDTHIWGGCARLGGCTKHGGGCMRHGGRTRCRDTCTGCHIRI